MTTLEYMKTLHPNAHVIALDGSELIFISYPGLTLAIADNDVIGFCVDGVWYADKDGNGSQILQNCRRDLLYIINVRVWMETRFDLLQHLKCIIRDRAQGREEMNCLERRLYTKQDLC